MFFMFFIIHSCVGWGHFRPYFSFLEQILIIFEKMRTFCNVHHQCSSHVLIWRTFENIGEHGHNVLGTSDNVQLNIWHYSSSELIIILFFFEGVTRSSVFFLQSNFETILNLKNVNLSWNVPVKLACFHIVHRCFAIYFVYHCGVNRSLNSIFPNLFFPIISFGFQSSKMKPLSPFIIRSWAWLW